MKLASACLCMYGENTERKLLKALSITDLMCITFTSVGPWGPLPRSPVSSTILSKSKQSCISPRFFCTLVTDKSSWFLLWVKMGQCFVCPMLAFTTTWTLLGIDSTSLCSEFTLSQHSVRVSQRVSLHVTVWLALSQGENHREEVIQVALAALLETPNWPGKFLKHVWDY